MLGASILLAVLAPAVLATPVARSTYAVKETHYVPRKWVQKGRAPKNQMLALQIGVKQGDFDELERHLYEGIVKSIDWGVSEVSSETQLCTLTLIRQHLLPNDRSYFL